MSGDSKFTSTLRPLYTVWKAATHCFEVLATLLFPVCPFLLLTFTSPHLSHHTTEACFNGVPFPQCATTAAQETCTPTGR